MGIGLFELVCASLYLIEQILDGQPAISQIMRLDLVPDRLHILCKSLELLGYQGLEWSGPLFRIPKK